MSFIATCGRPNPAGGMRINPDIDYLYRDLTTRSPTSSACMTDWSWSCRAVINYETIIHPLWNVPRRHMFDDDNDPRRRTSGSGREWQSGQQQLPAMPHDDRPGLTMSRRFPPDNSTCRTVMSIDEPDHFNAYRELLVTDNLQILDAGGMLVDATRVIGQDADGNDILDFIPYASPASAGSARASSDFFDRFNDPNDLIHFNILIQSGATAHRGMVGCRSPVLQQSLRRPGQLRPLARHALLQRSYSLIILAVPRYGRG